MGPAVKRFTYRQRLFVGHYLTTLNGAEAARRAGYKPSRAKETGSRLLAKPEIRAEIEAEFQKRHSDFGAGEALERVARIARAEPQEPNPGEILKALELILKLTGQLEERVRLVTDEKLDTEAAQLIAVIEEEFGGEEDAATLDRLRAALEISSE